MTASVGVDKHAFLHVEVRHVPALQSIVWLRRGWDDLRHIGLPSLAHGGLIAVLGAVLLTLCSSHVYLVSAAVTAYLLVGPVMTTGLCELSRRRAAREPLGFDESLEPLTRNRDGLVLFGVILAIIALLWFLASALIVQSIMHTSSPTLSVALWGGFTDAVTGPQVLAYITSGAVLAGIVFSLSVVSVPLIIDRNASAIEAVWTSLRVTFSNVPAMLVWAVLIVGLSSLGFATLLLGMVVVAPVLGHATWHAYRDLVR